MDQEVLKYAKSLPPSAIKPIAGKSIAQILFGTSTLRHSAVHRLSTSAAGIVNMLSAAITFAEALNDSKRAEKIAEMKMQLEASIEEIVQHQNLLERKLTDQLEDIARRRAELDKLEKSSIEEMLAADRKQRAEVGSAFQSVRIGSQQVSNPCACSPAPSFDRPKADSEAGENIESSEIGMFPHALGFHFKSNSFLYLFLTVPVDHEQKPQQGVNKTQAYDRSPLGEEKPHQGEEVENDDRSPRHDKNDCGVEEEPEVSELSLPILRSKGKKKKGKKAAASGWDIPAAEEAPILVDEAPASEDASPAPVHVAHYMGWEWARKGVWNFGATSDVPGEPHNAVEEAIPAEKPCFAAPEEASLRDEPYIIAPEEEHLPDDAFPAEEAVYKEDPMEKEKVAPETTLEASQAELITEGFDDAEEHALNRHDNIPHDLDDPYEPIPEPDVAPMHSAPAEDAEFLVPPPRPALSAVRHKFDFHPPPALAPSSIVTSVLEAAAPEAPTEDSHTITLKILNGSKVLRSIVFIRACTRTAILNEARAYCMKFAQDDQSFERLLAEEWDLALVSLKMYGYDMDLSTYKVENLSSLVLAIEKTGIPRFTLRISEM